MHLRNELYGVILTAFKNRNSYLLWIFEVMNCMGIFVSYQFQEKGGCIKCSIFLICKGNKINFTHIIVDYMGKQHVEG